jgi:hypothetical protein
MIDRSMISKEFLRRMREAGFECMSHDDFYKHRAEDPVWISDCARRRWLGVTSDCKLKRQKSSEKAAVVFSKGKLLIVKTVGASSAEWAMSITSRWLKIKDHMRGKGPLILKLGARSGHLRSLEIKSTNIYRPMEILDEGYQ